MNIRNFFLGACAIVFSFSISPVYSFADESSKDPEVQLQETIDKLIAEESELRETALRLQKEAQLKFLQEMGMVPFPAFQ